MRGGLEVVSWHTYKTWLIFPRCGNVYQSCVKTRVAEGWHCRRTVPIALTLNCSTLQLAGEVPYVRNCIVGSTISNATAVTVATVASLCCFASL